MDDYGSMGLRIDLPFHADNNDNKKAQLGCVKQIHSEGNNQSETQLEKGLIEATREPLFPPTNQMATIASNSVTNKERLLLHRQPKFGVRECENCELAYSVRTIPYC